MSIHKNLHAVHKILCFNVTFTSLNESKSHKKKNPTLGRRILFVNERECSNY